MGTHAVQHSSTKLWAPSIRIVLIFCLFWMVSVCDPLQIAQAVVCAIIVDVIALDRTWIGRRIDKEEYEPRDLLATDIATWCIGVKSNRIACHCFGERTKAQAMKAGVTKCKSTRRRDSNARLPSCIVF